MEADYAKPTPKPSLPKKARAGSHAINSTPTAAHTRSSSIRARRVVSLQRTFRSFPQRSAIPNYRNGVNPDF